MPEQFFKRDYIHGATNADTDWEKEHLFCQRRCLVGSVAVANKGADFWLWICDSPSCGAQKPTMAPIYVPGNTTQSLDWSLLPKKFSAGLYVCASTNPVTKTAPVTNDAFFEAAYELY